MLKKILEFMGGKNPKIFNRKGQVEHDLGNERWSEWDAKIRTSPDYDWKRHTGEVTVNVEKKADSITHKNITNSET